MPLSLANPPAQLPRQLQEQLAAKRALERKQAEAEKARAEAEAAAQARAEAEAAEKAAAERRQAQKAAAIAAREHIRGLLRGLGITVFDRQVPLKIGIGKDIEALLADEVGPADLFFFMRRHVSREPYLEALAAGEPRHDLSGATFETTEQDRKNAAARLKEIRERKAKRTAAITA